MNGCYQGYLARDSMLSALCAIARPSVHPSVCHTGGSVTQTVNDGVAHSKNPRKCAYMTFDLDLDLERTLDAR